MSYNKQLLVKKVKTQLENTLNIYLTIS